MTWDVCILFDAKSPEQVTYPLSLKVTSALSSIIISFLYGFGGRFPIWQQFSLLAISTPVPSFCLVIIVTQWDMYDMRYSLRLKKFVPQMIAALDAKYIHLRLVHPFKKQAFFPTKRVSCQDLMQEMNLNFQIRPPQSLCTTSKFSPVLHSMS